MGKDKTLLANVGDSRAYIYKDRKLTQVTKDDSKVQMLYDRGEITSKEDMRFNRVSNQIYKALGFPGHDEPTFSVLENSKYDTLMLLSDGVSDFLSEHDIKIICDKTPREELAKALIKAANYKKSRGPGKPGYYDVRNGGDDNATSAVTFNDR